jgi:hypothetical protein
MDQQFTKALEEFLAHPEVDSTGERVSTKRAIFDALIEKICSLARA